MEEWKEGGVSSSASVGRTAATLGSAFRDLTRCCRSKPENDERRRRRGDGNLEITDVECDGLLLWIHAVVPTTATLQHFYWCGSVGNSSDNARSDKRLVLHVRHMCACVCVCMCGCVCVSMCAAVVVARIRVLCTRENAAMKAFRRRSAADADCLCWRAATQGSVEIVTERMKLHDGE